MGGINGGLVLLRPSRQEFKEMLRHLDSYAGAGYGAEQDFLTDFWKTRTGIAGLPRRYNCQLHQVALLGPEAREDSLYWRMVINHREEVANWHFSADPKPVEMIWGSIAFPALETGSGLRRRGLGVPITSDVLRAATTTVHTESNWNTGEVHDQLRKDYHNQRRHAKLGRFDWREHNKQEERVFRDT